MQQREPSVVGWAGTAARMAFTTALALPIAACGLKGPLVAPPAASAAAASAATPR
ncbi:MAG: hypothetical protein ACXWJG_09440 [Caldimonas sp.]